MAFQYNDNRSISNHTHIDYPLTCGTNNAGNVTWVDFINFRNVDNFGIGTGKGSIGNTWLSVLERLQACFDDINVRLNNLDNRLTELEEGPSSITITGNTSFGSNSFITLQSSTNADWSIYDIITSDTSYGHTDPEMTLADTTNTSTKVVISNTPSFDNYKGTIDFVDYQIGGYASMDEGGINIKAIYMGDRTTYIKWEAKVKATSKTNSQISNYKTVNKIFDNPYNETTAGDWTWECSSTAFDIYPNGDSVYIKPNIDDVIAIGTLICRNTKASDEITLDINFEASEIAVTFEPNNGSNSWEEITHYNGSITIPDGPTKNSDNTYAYEFEGWYYYPDFSGQKYIPRTSFRVTSNGITFYAKYNQTYKTYTASFNSNGGNSVSSITGHYNDSITLPTASQVTKPASGNTTYELSKWIANGNSYNPGSAFNLQNNVTFTAQWTENTTELFTYYFGTATEDQIQSQSYINNLDYNRMDVKPEDLNFEEGYNVLIVPESWGTPTVKDPNGFPYSEFGLEELGITNPEGKIVLVYSSGPIDVTLEWN